MTRLNWYIQSIALDHSAKPPLVKDCVLVALYDPSMTAQRKKVMVGKPPATRNAFCSKHVIFVVSGKHF